MKWYLLRRLVQAVFVLWAAFTTSFLLLYALPGDPITIMLGAGGVQQSSYTPAQVAALRAQYGFDKPLLVQYFDRLWHALRGDFGHSIQTGDSVTHMIITALPPTLELEVTALAIGVVLGAGTALAGTYTRLRLLRQLLLSLPSVGISLPGFWVGLMLVEVVSFQWRALPATGNHGVASLILPAVTMAIPVAAMIGQVLARSMQTALAEAYVDTARAKGASRVRVHFRHAARNAAIPAVTLLGLVFGLVLANSVVVETVFARNGVGRITQAAVGAQDIPVVQGVVVLAALVFVVTNLIVDLVYPLLDPRITTARPGGLGRKRLGHV